MNIFYLHEDPKTCAEMHNDKHVVKMILEYAQLLSTAHRVLDGVPYIDKTANGRSIKRWRLDLAREPLLMKATHINHPSAVWARSTRDNYIWLYRLWYYLCKEYTFRYGKTHACERLLEALYVPPLNMVKSEFFPPTPAMPDTYKVKDDSLLSYRNYYNGGKQHLATWKLREAPPWFKPANA